MTNTSEMELKIIDAAIACIEKHGIRETTVRRIAQEAGANVAAINYYFHSKEQLMERVMEVTLANAFDWSHFGSSEGCPPKQRLAAILNHLTEGAQVYPELSRAHFVAPTLERNGKSMSHQRFREFVEKVYADLVERGARPGEALRHGLIQAVSASILGAGLFLELFGSDIGQGLKEPDARKRYIDSLVDGVL